jgi:putative transposase
MTTPDPYRGFRFPAEIIAHAVWLYHCFSLSLREVETILAQRGIVVETVRNPVYGRAVEPQPAMALVKRSPKRTAN